MPSAPATCPLHLGRRPWLWVYLVTGCCSVLLAAHPARATVVERVVAVVGEQAILLSDLRARAKPFLLRVYRQFPPGAQRTAAVSQMYELVLERMVDEELLQRAANRSHVAVSREEIDQAITRVAAQNGLTVEQILAEARRSGMNEQQYRREIRRQVLDVKMMNLRMQGRLRITAEDLRAHYQKLVLEERRKLWFRAAWILLGVPRDAAAARIERQRERAERVAAQARSGADFAKLASRHSDDAATRQTGGLLGELKHGALPRTVDRALLALEVGEVSGPLRTQDGFVVVKLLERDTSSLPSFEEAVEELHQRVYMDKLDEARLHWMKALRRQTHVEIRL
jgi:peptidyl-prolyl cis-trans isomerase SurA